MNCHDIDACKAGAQNCPMPQFCQRAPTLYEIEEPQPRYTQAPRYKYDKALGVATAIIVGIAFGVLLAR